MGGHRRGVPPALWLPVMWPLGQRGLPCDHLPCLPLPPPSSSSLGEGQKWVAGVVQLSWSPRRLSPTEQTPQTAPVCTKLNAAFWPVHTQGSLAQGVHTFIGFFWGGAHTHIHKGSFLQPPRARALGAEGEASASVSPPILPPVVTQPAAETPKCSHALPWVQNALMRPCPDVLQLGLCLQSMPWDLGNAHPRRQAWGGGTRLGKGSLLTEACKTNKTRGSSGNQV